MTNVGYPLSHIRDGMARAQEAAQHVMGLSNDGREAWVRAFVADMRLAHLKSWQADVSEGMFSGDTPPPPQTRHESFLRLLLAEIVTALAQGNVEFALGLVEPRILHRCIAPVLAAMEADAAGEGKDTSSTGEGSHGDAP